VVQYIPDWWKVPKCTFSSMLYIIFLKTSPGTSITQEFYDT